jgi:hypothetical protein
MFHPRLQHQRLMSDDVVCGIRSRARRLHHQRPTSDPRHQTLEEPQGGSARIAWGCRTRRPQDNPHARASNAEGVAEFSSSDGVEQDRPAAPQRLQRCS